MGKVWDITPANNLPAYLRGYGSRTLRTVRTSKLIAELYNRGVSVEDIFGQYYEMEAIADAKDDDIFGNDEEGNHGDPNRFKQKPLTVGDAMLVAPALPAKTPLGKTPF